MKNNFGNIGNDVKIFKLMFLLLIFVGFATEVNAIVPVTYKCCVNYSNSPGIQIYGFENVSNGSLAGTQLENFEENGSLGGTQIYDFENISSWTVATGSIEADTVNFKGQQGIKIISDWANASKSDLNRTTIDKDINYNFANASNFGIWLYIPDTTNFSFFRVYFTSNGSNFGTYFTYSKYTGFSAGWNKLVFNKNDPGFTNNNESWNNTMNRIRIAVYPTLGNDTNATVDDLSFNVGSDWIVSYGFMEPDTINFKEGLQAIKIISPWAEANLTNLQRTTIDKDVNYNLTNANFFSIWVYVYDNSTFGGMNIFLTSTGANFSKYFAHTIFGLKNGWTKVVFDKSSFNDVNGEDWNNTMNRIKIAVYPNPGTDTNITLDDFRYYPDWVVGGNGYAQADTVNYKEGLQGLRLVSSDIYDSSTPIPNTTSPILYGSTLDNKLNINLSNMNNIVYWVYIDDLSNLSYIRLELTSNGSNFNTLLYDQIYQNNNVKSGWNKLVFNRHNFINIGENWNTVNQIRFAIGALNSGVTLDDLRYNMSGQRAKLMIEFDDGEEDVYTKALPILINNNQTATAFIVPQWVSDPPDTAMSLTQLHVLQDAGWDISSHSNTHPDGGMVVLDNSTLVTELNNSYDYFVTNNFQKTAGFLAYPWGTFNDNVLNHIKQRYIFGRATVVESSQQHFSPDDDGERYIQRVVPISDYHTIHDGTTLQTIKDYLNDTISSKLLGTLLFHGINDSVPYPMNDTTTYNTQDFQSVSDYIKSRSADIDVVTESDYVIPNINNFTPVINKNTSIYSNGTSILITKNKYDEYMPNMTVKPSSGSIYVNITLYNDNYGIILFNESSRTTNLQVSYDIGDRVPNKTYLVKIYWANGTKYKDFNVTADSAGHIKYNSTGFGSPRYQMISTPLSIIYSSPSGNNTVSPQFKLQQFQIGLNRNADITWLVDGIIVQTDISVFNSSYSNQTATTGIHNVTAIADDGLNDGRNSTATRSWNWSVVNNIYNIVHQKYIYQKQNMVINFSLNGFVGNKTNINITSPKGIVTPFTITMKNSSENDSITYTGVNELGVYRIVYSTPKFITSSTFEYKQKPILTFVSASDLHYGYTNDSGIQSGFTINRLISDINNKVFFPSPDFVALVGDTADSALNNYINDSKVIYDSLNVPYYITIGNHEMTTTDELTFEPIGFRGETFYNAYKDKYNNDSTVNGSLYNYTVTKGGYTFIFGGIGSDYPPFTSDLGQSFGDKNFAMWLNKTLENSAYKPTIAFSHQTAQQPRCDNGGTFIWEQDPFGPKTRSIFEKYKNMPVELSGDGHMVSKNVVNNITYLIDGAIINLPYVFDYVEVYPDRIQVHTIPYRLDTDTTMQFDRFYNNNNTDIPCGGKHTIANYSIGNPDENDFTITLVNITPTTLTNLWNFTANNIPTGKITLGNNNINLNNITADLLPFESRNIINMTANTSNNSIVMNVTTFNDTVKFNELPSNSSQVFYNIGDRIPNQSYSVKIFRPGGTYYQNFNIIANKTGYISYNLTISEARYQEITPYQPIVTTFTVNLPGGYSYVRFNTSNSTIINLNPDGQNDSQPMFNITNNGNVNQSIMLNLSGTITNITTYADLSNNFSIGKIKINASPTIIIPNLAPNSSQKIWVIVDVDKASPININNTLVISSAAEITATQANANVSNIGTVNIGAASAAAATKQVANVGTGTAAKQVVSAAAKQANVTANVGTAKANVGTALGFDTNNPASYTVQYIILPDTSFSVSLCGSENQMNFNATNGSSKAVEPNCQSIAQNKPWANITNTGNVPLNFSTNLMTINPAWVILNIGSTSSMSDQVTITNTTNSPVGWLNIGPGNSVQLYTQASFMNAPQGTTSMTIKINSNFGAFSTDIGQYSINYNIPSPQTPNIISLGNSKTNDSNQNISINISEQVKFNITADQSIDTWQWNQDDITQNNNFDNFTTSWSTAGNKIISVNGTNINGTTNTINWNVTVLNQILSQITKTTGPNNNKSNNNNNNNKSNNKSNNNKSNNKSNN